MKKFLFAFAVCGIALAPGPSLADALDRARQAYQNFKQIYARLPQGVCENPSTGPYRAALAALDDFEQVAAGVRNPPDLSTQRAYLAGIVFGGAEVCSYPSAGILFRCDGPCPSLPSTREYSAGPELPRAEAMVARPQAPAPARLDGRSVTRAVFDNGGWLEMRPNGLWDEFSADGRRIAEFKEIARDEWSVYLDDPSRDLQLQVDLYRKWVSLGYRMGPRQDQYRIIGAEGR